jgi:sec-independent protein translocase protein TatA
MIGDILQPTHLIFILVVALLVLGPKRLPEVGRSLGKGLRDFRGALSGLEEHTSMTPSEPAVAEPVTPAVTSMPSDPEAAPAAPVSPGVATTTDPDSASASPAAPAAVAAAVATTPVPTDGSVAVDSQAIGFGEVETAVHRRVPPPDENPEPPA